MVDGIRLLGALDNSKAKEEAWLMIMAYEVLISAFPFFLCSQEKRRTSFHRIFTASSPQVRTSSKRDDMQDVLFYLLEYGTKI